jgi:hypothetical protein
MGRTIVGVGLAIVIRGRDKPLPLPYPNEGDGKEGQEGRDIGTGMARVGGEGEMWA